MMIYRTLVAVAALSIASSVNAATVSDTGFGFTYRIFAGRDSGNTTKAGNDGSLLSIDESVIGTIANIADPSTADVNGSLSSGKIGAKTSNESNLSSQQASFAHIRLYDTLFFDLSSFDASFRGDITFNYSLDGSYTTNGAGVTNGANVVSSFTASRDSQETLQATIFYASDGNGSDGDAIIGTTYTAAIPDAYSIDSTTGSWDSLSSNGFSGGTLTLIGGKINTVSISYWLQTIGNADFSHTAGLAIDSPFAYTSASGIFLTATVPIPASLPFLTAGLALLGFVGRRRRISEG